MGILGGFGPLAGAYFYRRLVELEPAHDDDQHLSVILMANRGVPSRLDFLEGRSAASPVPSLMALARRLEAAGATLIAIPSATVHSFYDEIQGAVAVPVLHLPQETIRAGLRFGTTLALLATTPTVQLGLYQKADAGALVRILEPDLESQQQIMDVIQQVKQEGNSPQVRAVLAQVASAPWAQGADAVILGCTELPVIADGLVLDKPIVSATDALAHAVIRQGYAL